MAGAQASALTSTFGLARELTSRSHAVPVLQLFALTVMVIPSDTVIQAIGAGGYPAGLVGLFAFAAFMTATLLGLHNPLEHRHPVRTVICLLWAAALASYVLMDTSTLTVIQTASADRFLMELAVITGVVLVAAECLTSLSDIRRVLRALVWGGAICGAVAALQFWMSLDLAPYLREIPGFSLNFDNAGILDRAALNRVAGTAIHPIELGVVAGMLLPLAIWLAMHDTGRSARVRWAPVVLIGIAIPTSISRSAILSVALALGVFVMLMPARQRLIGMFAVPLGLCAVFMSAPGIIGTLTSFFEAGTSDPSVATRVDDYPMAERLVHQAPWFGHGPGTYIPDNAFDIFDNEYLKTSVELGLVGLVALVAYLALPAIFALVARRHSRDPELRTLCAALAGTALAATVCSFTFDSLSFPMFANVSALVVGLIGACWRLAAADRAPTPPDDDGGPISNHLEAGARASATRTVLPAGG
jgi:O-Antigen ligase